jgi:hypothetical protein
MSIRVMTAVWALDLPAGEKLLLLALADCANDEGFCWPGMRSLKAKTGKCERSLQAAIKSLCAAGHLTRVEVPGKGCNYTVHPRNNCTPAETAPPQKLTETPAKTAGKPSRTTIGSEAKASSPRAKLSRPDGVSAEQWSAFKAQRKKPLNERSYVLLTNKLNALADDGYPPGEMIDLAIERGWETVFKPFAQRENYNGGNHQHLGKSGQAFAMQGDLSDDRPF